MVSCINLQRINLLTWAGFPLEAYVLQYDETEYMFQRWWKFMLRFANYKFEIFIYEDKYLWNWFEWLSSYTTYFSQNKIWNKVWTKEINMSQFQAIW